MLLRDTAGDRRPRRVRGFSDFSFTAADLDQWTGLAVTDPVLVSQIVQKSVTPLPQTYSCPAGYALNPTTKMCHLAAQPTSPVLIFGLLGGAALLLMGGK